MRKNGFSLIELLVTLTLVTILVTGVTPSLHLLQQKLQIDMFTQSLCNALALSRNESVMRQQRITLHNINNQWQNGWHVFVDSNNNGVKNDNEELLLSYIGPSNSSITAKGNNNVKSYISYLPNGSTYLTNNAFQAGTITICHTNPKVSGRQIILSRGGRIRIMKLPLDTPHCP